MPEIKGSDPSVEPGDGRDSKDEERALEFMRRVSLQYQILLKNMILSYESRGFDVRAHQGTRREPEMIDGLKPCLTVEGGAEFMLLEIATASMLRNPQLAVRLRHFSGVPGMRRWLVVPFDSVMEAQDLLKQIDGKWDAIVGDP